MNVYLEEGGSSSRRSFVGVNYFCVETLTVMSFLRKKYKHRGFAHGACFLNHFGLTSLPSAGSRYPQRLVNLVLVRSLGTSRVANAFTLHSSTPSEVKVPRTL